VVLETVAVIGGACLLFLGVAVVADFIEKRWGDGT